MLVKGATCIIDSQIQEKLVWAFPAKLPSGECHRTSLMMNQQWFRRQTIAWAKAVPDLCRHMAPPGRSELWANWLGFVVKYTLPHNDIKCNVPAT